MQIQVETIEPFVACLLVRKNVAVTLNKDTPVILLNLIVYIWSQILVLCMENLVPNRPTVPDLMGQMPFRGGCRYAVSKVDSALRSAASGLETQIRRRPRCQHLVPSPESIWIRIGSDS